MKAKNDTRGLRREMSSLLSKSEAWLVLRIDDEGLHLHTPEESQIALIGMFLKNNPELASVIQEIANEVEPSLN